ncbi:MAG: tetratricopeptide repeat protein [Thermodesulfobacteriota bacterium]
MAGLVFYRKILPLLFIGLFCLSFACAGKGPRGEEETHMGEKQIEARLDLAERYFVQGKTRQAIQQLLKVQNQNPNIPRLNFDLGLAYSALNDPDKAIDSYKKAVQTAPDYGEAWNNLGLIYMSEGDLDNAEQSFKKALKIVTYISPEKPAYNLAQLFDQKNDLQQALKYARLSVQENWRFIAGYIYSADLLQRLGRDKQAREMLHQGTEAVPDNLEITLKLAESLVRSGKNQKAKQWFEQIVRENPESNQAKVARDYLEFLE